MRKHLLSILLGTLLGTQAPTLYAQYIDQWETGGPRAWPPLYVPRMPAQLKYYEERDRQIKEEVAREMATKKPASQGSSEVERGPWPARFVPRMPAQLKYYEERDRQIKEEVARAGTLPSRPTAPYSNAYSFFSLD